MICWRLHILKTVEMICSILGSGEFLLQFDSHPGTASSTYVFNILCVNSQLTVNIMQYCQLTVAIRFGIIIHQSSMATRLGHT